MSVAVVTLAGGSTNDVLSCQITLPLRGVWSARLEIDADADVPLGPATISLARDDGAAPTAFVGSVLHAATFGGRAKVWIQGGKGLLSGELAAQLQPKNYVATPRPVDVRAIVEDIAKDAGETLSPTATITTTVPRWLRAAGTGAAALAALGLAWRVLADGTLWVGEETWPTATDVKGLFEMGDDGGPLVLDVAQESAGLVPGTVVLGKRIVEVGYAIAGSVRAELHYGAGNTALFDAAIAASLPSPVYSRTYGATVRAQHADDTVDLEADDPAIGHVTDVPLRVGIPTARVLVVDGTRVRLAFEAGSPAAPYATGIDADSSAAKGVARVGDTIDIGTLTYIGAGSLTWTHPDPSHVPPVYTAPTPFPLQGIISSGSTKVLLG